jgi:hypothetical protein
VPPPSRGLAAPPASLLTRLLRATWGLFVKPIKWLWKFTFQRWWNFLISIPAIGALVAAFGALTVADIGVVIAVTVLVGIRAGFLELVQTVRRSGAKPLPKRR